MEADQDMNGKIEWDIGLDVGQWDTDFGIGLGVGSFDCDFDLSTDSDQFIFFMIGLYSSMYAL